MRGCKGGLVNGVSTQEGSYGERLKAMGLPSMYYRCDRGNMIECYKFSHKIYKVVPMLDLEITSAVRGHSLKLKKHHSKRTVHHQFFS